jgi:hypothetical protein
LPVVLSASGSDAAATGGATLVLQSELIARVRDPA